MQSLADLQLLTLKGRADAYFERDSSERTLPQPAPTVLVMNAK